MPDPTPLGPLLDWLVDFHGYPLTVGDRDRVDRFLQYSRVPDRNTLRSSLATLLTRDPETYATFPKHFDEFFHEADDDKLDPNQPWDASRMLRELHAWQPPEAREKSSESRLEQSSPMLPTDSDDEDAAPIPAPPVLYEIRPIQWPQEVPRPWLDYPGEEPLATPVTLNFDAYPDPKAQSFHLSDVLPPPRRLDDPLLDELAEAMGYFRRIGLSDDFDVEQSIQASIDAGFPVHRFLPGRELGRILLLEDQQTPALAWNPVATEMVAGLECRGIPVVHGRFRGNPAYFQTVDHSYEGHLDDWDEDRDSTLLVVVTDGAGLFPARHRQLVEDLATWPRVAWIDPREEPFWDAGSDLARDHKIPLFEATPRGLRQFADQLLSEGGRSSPAAARIFIHEERRVLEHPRALEWAAACAQLPVATPGLAEALRVRFFPELPPHLYGRLLELRGAYWSGTGVFFSEELRHRLEACYDHSPSVHRSAVCSVLARLLLRYSQANQERIPADSPAAKACEVFQLTFEVGGCDDLVQRNRILRRLIPLAGDGAPFEGVWRAELKARVDSAVGTTDSPMFLALGFSLKPSSWSLVEGLVLIPAGNFLMGDWSGKGDDRERPVHRVHVSDFRISRELVSWELWQRVRAWSASHGYDLAESGNGMGPRHPVTDVSWYDVLKWCNALSEMENRQPAYYCDLAHTKPYQEGALHLTSDCVDWSADGYRLPTEAEWEKAARGGLEKNHFPWPSSRKNFASLISPRLANYDESNMSGPTPVDAYPANGFGLHDMAGNVWQWIWDGRDEKWYAKSGATQPDNRGPDHLAKGEGRVIRGGRWTLSARSLRCSVRNGFNPASGSGGIGFRVTLGLTGRKSASEGGSTRRDDDSPNSRGQAMPHSCLRVKVPDLSSGQIYIRRVEMGGESFPMKPNQLVPLVPGRWEIEVTALEHSRTRVTITLEPNAAAEVRCQLAPEDFVRVSGGQFQMGDPIGEGFSDERPVHEVLISEFWVGRYTVCWELWRRVAEWAATHGYDLSREAIGSDGNHPVVNVTWWDTVKWCNAFSEYVGRLPAYYLDSNHRQVLRTGTPAIAADWVQWRGPGYRLPTEAEWEKAARGGLVGHPFPWPSKGRDHLSTILVQLANYKASGIEGTMPVNTYPANRYGLHNMAGNVWQWVWDRGDSGWYSNPLATAPDSTGPDESAHRVIRGGCWANSARNVRCSCRRWFDPSYRNGSLGFRLALGQALQTIQEVEPVGLAAGGFTKIIQRLKNRMSRLGRD